MTQLIGDIQNAKRGVNEVLDSIFADAALMAAWGCPETVLMLDMNMSRHDRAKTVVSGTDTSQQQSLQGVDIQ